AIEAIVGEAPTFSDRLLELAKWMAGYYCCPLETVLRSILPQVIRRAEIGWKNQLFVQPMSKVDKEEIVTLRRRAPRQAELPESAKPKSIFREFGRHWSAVEAPSCSCLKFRSPRKRWNDSRVASPRCPMSWRFCTATCRKASATTNGTSFIPAVPALLLVRGARYLRRSKISD